MPSACSRVVELPELVTAILEQLHDNKALFAALQVNKLWADEATTLLWSGKSATSALARIEDAKRRQYYAAKASTMELYCDCEGNVCQGHSGLQNLHFPRLSNLSLDIGGRGHEEILLQALQPRLRTLTWFGRPASKYSLTQIHARCPALQSLHLQDRIYTTTTDDLLQFLSGLPSLTSIHLEYYSVSDEVYIHLASRPNLASLKTSPRMIIKLSVIKRVQEMVTQPFSELVELSCALEGKAFSQLSPHLATLTKLKLYLFDVASNTVSGICSCTGLVSLVLDFGRSSHLDAKAHFPPESLLAIANSCSHLQTFDVKDVQMERSMTGINDDVIQSFVALLPGLLCFRLQIKTNVTHRALKILGEGCAHMRDCALEGKSFNLKRLESKGPVLFPHLKWLELQPPVVGHSAAELAKILHHHAPCVERFTIGGSRRFYQDIDYEIRELQRRDKGWSLV